MTYRRCENYALRQQDEERIAWVQALPKPRDLYTIQGSHSWCLDGFSGGRNSGDMKFCPQLPNLGVHAVLSLIQR